MGRVSLELCLLTGDWRRGWNYRRENIRSWHSWERKGWIIICLLPLQDPTPEIDTETNFPLALAAAWSGSYFLDSAEAAEFQAKNGDWLVTAGLLGWVLNVRCDAKVESNTENSKNPNSGNTKGHVIKPPESPIHLRPLLFKFILYPNVFSTWCCILNVNGVLMLNSEREAFCIPYTRV